MAIPIFVLGAYRSGTTWVNNIFNKNSNVVAVPSSGRFGTAESFYFTVVHNRYGDLSDRARYVEFIEIVSRGQYFKNAGVTREFLYSLYPATYAEVFRAVMDRFAEMHNATHWVEKTPGNTRVWPQIAAFYPTARFVGILRDPVKRGESALAIGIQQGTNAFEKPSKARSRFLILQAAQQVYYKKLMVSPKIKLIHYEELLQNQEATVRVLCEHTG